MLVSVDLMNIETHDNKSRLAPKISSLSVNVIVVYFVQMASL
jgi:hypothetical protein